MAQIASVARKLRNGAVFSHASAALLHGLWLLELPDRPEVTQRSRPNTHGATSLKRHCGELPDDAVTALNGVRVTTIERTIVDCARTMHPRDAMAVADAGMRAFTRPDRFNRATAADRIAALRQRLLDMVGHGAGHGRRRARAVIRYADPYAESPKESVLRWIAVSRGLPEPTAQLRLRTRAGTFYADLGWQWRRLLSDGSYEVRTVLAEYDGEVKYRPDGGLVASIEESSAVVVAEKRREDLIREDRGTSVLRFVRQDLRDPDAVFRRLLMAMPQEIRANVQPVPELLAGP